MSMVVTGSYIGSTVYNVGEKPTVTLYTYIVVEIAK